MTLLLGIPSPQRVRLAMQAKHKSPQLPFAHVLKESGQDAPSGQSSPLPEVQSEPAQVAAAPVQSAPVNARPLQVASADPSMPLGVTSAPPAAVPAAPPMPIAEMAPRSIPVPDPVAPGYHPAAVTQADLMDIKQELLRLQLSMLQREVKDSQQQIAPPPKLTREEPAHVARILPLEPETRVAQAAQIAPRPRGVEVVRVEDPARRTFRFIDVPLETVFRTLGEEAGWQVMTTGVSGNYTGEFVNADPAQAFALMLRANKLTISLRGSYRLVTPLQR
ncbi:hypothetical protein [Planctomicrobium sp. SH664]|uniref:hypothetical protein n=1 Tax=Planctomicrobium sp. SH664 TaxID=3448125 RepID=UPI003F5C3615